MTRQDKTRQDKTRQDKNENSCILIPCCIDKNKPDGSYGKLQDAKLCDIGTPIARTLVTHEPGLTNHHCNLVIVKMNKDKQPILEENKIIIGGMQKNQAIKDDGIWTTLTSAMGEGGGYIPMITEKIAIKQATKEGYIEMESGGVADLSYPGSETRRARVQDNGKLCPTLTASNSNICRVEKIVKVGQISNDGSQGGAVYSENGINPTLCACTHGYAMGNILTQYRIRKLTPKECYRLMGFSDEAFEKASSVCSNTQLYKQAGNSIVVDVLENIFAQLF